ncbi:response regulator transcription factor [Bacillaceae bacterium S4-13-58]
MNKRVLVVDDEQQIRETISNFLVKEGYSVFEAENGDAALRCLKDQKLDIILLDIMMPETDGYQVLREIRAYSKHLPVIMLTAKTDELDKLLGLELGADDYITKPFSIREVVARMKAVWRRTSAQEADEKGEIIKRGPIEIDMDTYTVTVNDEKVNLTPTEFKILHTLAAKPGRVYSRLQLMNIAIGEEYVNYERSIDTHVSNLRKKLKVNSNIPDYIHTVYGIGYRFGD